MSRRFRSLWQVLVRDNAKRQSRCHSLTVEKLEERCLLTGGYLQTNLVSDIPGLARRTDPNLVNPWGIIASPDGHLRISDNGTGLSTLYVHNGTALPQVVTIPPPAGSPPGTTAAPTGNILNTTSDFVISGHGKPRPSTFIFATEDGTLSGWTQQVDRTNAILTVDNSASGAVYKGLALGSNAQGNFLFATDFHNNKIDVFNGHFQQVTLGTGGFGTFTDPMEPVGFAPFGIELINGILFVTYAKQKGPDNEDDQAGPGNGLIDEFDTSGHFLKRFASGSNAGGLLTELNSPWGMAVAPDDFGQFSQALLVGNFGDGRINAFHRTTGAFLGQLSDPAGQPITIDGLWGITFSRDNTLFFAAGINDEADGLFGTLTPADDGPGGSAASNSGRAQITEETAALVALLSPLAKAPSPAVQNSIAAPADATTGTRGQTIATPTHWLMDAVSVRIDSREVIDRAFGDFHPLRFESVLANDLANALAI